ncbi:GHKL domain-containing protein [Flavobacterium sp. NST-5]|uniref:histidine kinase n=1 Tax=Flavobacterium ichthyis TaxID=2698827 RepID=A0ABW9ZAK0_9FLAO|nr:ATP-binding protein [Flavobacterium ichthyis]NBL65931.1 GHKL domain-containing protein [Flavobacterium ichthyis]
MKLSIYQNIFLQIVAVLAAISISGIAFFNNLIYTALFFALLTILLLIALFSKINNTFYFYEKTINAILNNDFTADFNQKSQSGNYRLLFTLYNRLKEKQHDQVSRDLIYRSILNNIETGVLILQKDQDDWKVFLMNDYFSEHFQVPKVSRWHYLQKQFPAFCEKIEGLDFGEIKTTVQIKFDHQEAQNYMLQASTTTAYQKEYYVIMVDSIQKVIEKKEKEAWVNLMKVISHELLNSITPIRSLTQNLHELVQQENLQPDDLSDIRESVETIIKRSNHLQNFVESYRKLAMLPNPEKKRIEMNSLINSSLKLMETSFAAEHIVVENKLDFKLYIFADETQMEQVFINLFTNSIYALQGSENKKIVVNAELKNNRVLISITDFGNGIEKEIQDKIFLPFFTTRKDGAGIGLTLSKNIVEAHGGYLQCKFEEGKTVFTISLLH